MPSIARTTGMMLLALSLLAAACGDGDEADSTTETISTGASTTTPANTAETESGNDDPADPVTGVVDLTDQILVSTDADCASYAGEYVSMITDVSSGEEFEGVLTISADGDACVFDANQIPNHDTGEGGDFRTPIDEIDATRVITTSPVLAASPTALDFQTNAVMTRR